MGALLCERIGFDMFSAGSTLGLRQRVIDSLDSLHLVRGVGVFLRKPINLAVFSAGSTLGLRAPDCAKETSLPGLSSFDSRRGCALRGEQSAYHAAFG